RWGHVVEASKHRGSAPPVRSSCGRGPCRSGSEPTAVHGTYGSPESATGTKTLGALPDEGGVLQRGDHALETVLALLRVRRPVRRWCGWGRGAGPDRPLLTMVRVRARRTRDLVPPSLRKIGANLPQEYKYDFHHQLFLFTHQKECVRNSTESDSHLPSVTQLHLIRRRKIVVVVLWKAPQRQVR